ncbi:3-hydroxyisobutyrate dehydrogenase [Aquabacterium sp. CECT 9606]|uniref:3-hydroxyisobutyrate dehydrogenase n=1 Tax=Aquabacterium sp. CECT 9606 TaxID=2845822 RepID=UPI001E3C6FFB|nr:3-hydroxyisobutyrate dehydrogenase [Aquabacterium sp. CECT 9606]CAH0352857.1 3-hydroxyisobutyrate dehydrogenase [Aquabacterium sp. CECT 9606]
MKIAFIGLGNMGAPMAGNLLKAGHELAVYDLDAAALDRLATQGARPGASLADTVDGAEMVITMLPAARHVDKVINGEGGVLGYVQPGVPIVDCSTIGPATARQLSASAQAHGNAFADAPVSGGTGGAAAGTLTFMVGGDEALFERIKPVLQCMGRNIVHCGAVGNGQVAKLCNNLLLGVTMVGVSEAMSLGTSQGMDAKVLAGIINTSTGRCWSSDTYNPFPGVIDGAPASRGYTGGFGVDLMLKDLGLAMDAAHEKHQPLPMGALAQDLYQQWSSQGQGALDFSSIIKLLATLPSSP